MNLDQFRALPPFARHVAVVRAFLALPKEKPRGQPDPDNRFRSKSKDGRPLREHMLPLFDDGQPHSFGEMAKLWPEYTIMNIRKTAYRAMELGQLEWLSPGVYRRAQG